MTKTEEIVVMDKIYPSSQNVRKEIVDTVSQKILDNGKKIVISPEELYLSLDEAITNAMEHGNRWDPKKTIRITIKELPDIIRVSISDQGKGFNTEDIQANLKTRNILSSRGRGIYIINQFCGISWNKKGNEINLDIKYKDDS